MPTHIVFGSKQIFCEQRTLHMSLTNKQRPSSSSSREATTQQNPQRSQFSRKKQVLFHHMIRLYFLDDLNDVLIVKLMLLHERTINQCKEPNTQWVCNNVTSCWSNAYLANSLRLMFHTGTPYQSAAIF